MGLFSPRTPPARPTSEPDRVSTLERRIEDGERALRALQLEWSDTLDRLNRIAGRLAKRAERAADREDDQAHDPAPMNGSGEAARQVQLRRSRVFPGGGR